MDALFTFELPKDDSSKIENVTITQLLLYYTKEEHTEVKQLCKIGMKDLYPGTLLDSNISDFILQLLRKHYGPSNK